ncbi:MAG: hypothetical protein MZV70_46775, partial [Desulfobacterales bacterium]|nr:hypothetical protein [Desulfobacterales bacterium]
WPLRSVVCAKVNLVTGTQDSSACLGVPWGGLPVVATCTAAAKATCVRPAPSRPSCSRSDRPGPPPRPGSPAASAPGWGTASASAVGRGARRARRARGLVPAWPRLPTGRFADPKTSSFIERAGPATAPAAAAAAPGDPRVLVRARARG